jgi:phosphate transport system substrate-binding protein
MLQQFLRFAALSSVILFFSSCNDKKDSNTQTFTDTPTAGAINIVADETYAPVVQAQADVYMASYPNTKLNIEYLPEATCIKKLYNDSSIRMAIVTRGATKEEENFINAKYQYKPKWNVLATDAVVLVLPKDAPDSIFTLAQLKGWLTGKVKTNKEFVFDGISQTGTARYIKDSVLKNEAYDTSVVKAERNSERVLAYVSKTPNAVGFIGINQIGNPEDAKQVEWLKKVKLAHIQCVVCTDRPNVYVYPAQATILNHAYPLVRGLHFILKENHVGLGTGFVNFMRYERGQLIFKRAYLGSIMNFNKRKVIINDSIPKD